MYKCGLGNNLDIILFKSPGFIHTQNNVVMNCVSGYRVSDIILKEDWDSGTRQGNHIFPPSVWVRSNCAPASEFLRADRADFA